MDDTDKNPDIDAVIRKIQKMLTRTQGNASEEEADAAMKIVQEYMAKYNLDMATIDARGSGPEDGNSVRVDETSKAKAKFQWQRDLAKYVAEANFCLYILSTDYKKDENGYRVYGTDGRKVRVATHRFIGRKANVITTQLMFDYLCSAVEDALPIEKRTERFSRSSSSWKDGCATKICERLAKRREDLMAAHDAKVKAAEAAFQTEAKRRSEAAKAKSARVLGPRDATEEEMVSELQKGARVRTGMKSEFPVEEPERPEVDAEDDWIPGMDAEPEEDVEAPVTTLVLSSVYDDREKELNNDIARGWEPGTTTKRRLEREERYAKEAAAEAEKERLEAEDRKLHPEKYVEDEPVPVVETERQRKARIRREAKEHEQNMKYWARMDEREWKKEMREHEKRDHSAYKAGLAKGEDIGLDPQVRAKADAKRLGK